MLNQFDNLWVWCLSGYKYSRLMLVDATDRSTEQARAVCRVWCLLSPCGRHCRQPNQQTSAGFLPSPHHRVQCRAQVSGVHTANSGQCHDHVSRGNLEPGQAAHLNILLKNGECWKLSSQPTIPNYLQKTHLINVKLLWKVHHQCIYCLAFQNEHWGSTEKIVDGFIGQSVQCPLA